MRSRLDTQLEKLNNLLISMGALCENAIAVAVKALLNNDIVLAKTVKNVEIEIDQKEKEIENLCLNLILQQQPVAKDLRLISAALKMITDMERIGDQAADIAEIVSYIDLSDSIHKVHISEMAEATIKMVTDSIDAFVKRKLEAAEEVTRYD
jgi:phosphate transport system protein